MLTLRNGVHFTTATKSRYEKDVECRWHVATFSASGWDEILPDVTLYFSFNYYNVPVSIYKRVMKTDTVQLYYLPALIFDEAQANWAIAQGKIYFNLFVEDDDLVRAANSAFQQVKSKYSPVRFILPIPIKAVRIVRVSGTLAGLDNTWSSWNCIDYGAQATKCRLSLKCIDQAACHAISEDFTHRLAEFPRDFRVYYSLTERMDGQLLWLDRPNESEAHSITVLNKNIGHPVDQIIMAKPGKEGTKPVSATTVALPSTAESVWKFTRSSTSDPDLVDPVDELVSRKIFFGFLNINGCRSCSYNLQVPVWDQCGCSVVLEWGIL